jgi:hypothetical protein
MRLRGETEPSGVEGWTLSVEPMSTDTYRVTAWHAVWGARFMQGSRVDEMRRALKAYLREYSPRPDFDGGPEGATPDGSIAYVSGDLPSDYWNGPSNVREDPALPWHYDASADLRYGDYRIAASSPDFVDVDDAVRWAQQRARHVAVNLRRADEGGNVRGQFSAGADRLPGLPEWPPIRDDKRAAT